MDFLHGYLDGSVEMIILKPKQAKENIAAIAKPFQFCVYFSYYKAIENLLLYWNNHTFKYIGVDSWIGLFSALISTIVALYLINRCVRYMWKCVRNMEHKCNAG